jgi:hypothetical protein
MKQIYCLDLNKTFKSATEAEKQTGVCRTSIVKVCNGKRATAGGLIWSYVSKSVPCVF